jgi:hypothetical protein
MWSVTGKYGNNMDYFPGPSCRAKSVDSSQSMFVQRLRASRISLTLNPGTN